MKCIFSMLKVPLTVLFILFSFTVFCQKGINEIENCKMKVECHFGDIELKYDIIKKYKFNPSGLSEEAIRVKLYNEKQEVYFKIPYSDALFYTKKVLIKYKLQTDGTGIYDSIKVKEIEWRDDFKEIDKAHFLGESWYGQVSIEAELICDNKPSKKKIQHLKSKGLLDEVDGDGNYILKSGISLKFTDQRDGKSYKTIKVAGIEWMAENLAYKPKQGCWAYKNDTKNIAKHGYLYDWEIAKKICPFGWKLPQKEDFEKLINHIGEDSRSAYWAIIEGGKSGFESRPGGWRVNEKYFTGINDKSLYWTSSPDGEHLVWVLHIEGFYKHAEMNARSKKGTAFSVRCIKEELEKK